MLQVQTSYSEPNFQPPAHASSIQLRFENMVRVRGAGLMHGEECVLRVGVCMQHQVCKVLAFTVRPDAFTCVP